jgi:hypothetical protein
LGNIFGFAFSTDGTTHAVLWKPVPEPSSIVLAALGTFGLAAIARRRRNLRN